MSNEQKAIVAFTDEYIASNYINKEDIILPIRKNFGPKVVLVNMSLYRIDDIMKNNMTIQSQMGPNLLLQQLVKSPLETIVVNPNSTDFFIPLNIPYIMRLWEKNKGVLDLSIEDIELNKGLSIYELDTDMKKYVFSANDVSGEGLGNEGI